jgi:hypothetical protein
VSAKKLYKWFCLIYCDESNHNMFVHYL